MHRSLRAPVFGLALVCAATTSAQAQNPGRSELIDKLAPPPTITIDPSMTTGASVGSSARPRRASRPKPIVVRPGREDELLAATRDLPSADLKVLFEYDSDRLTTEGRDALAPLGEALQDARLQSSRFLIAGHTDAKGSDRYNENLSLRRARAVREHLVRSYRVEPGRLSAIGFGKRRLADPAKPEDPINRRVEVVNLGGFAQGPSSGQAQTTGASIGRASDPATSRRPRR